MRDPEFLYTFQQVDQGEQVVFKVKKGLFHRFAHRFIRGKMNNAADVIILLEDGKRVIIIAEIHFVILHFLPGDLRDPLHHIGSGTRVIICRDDFIAVFNQVHNGV